MARSAHNLSMQEALAADLSSSAMPRWQRKALAVNVQNTSVSSAASSSVDSPSCDRYISNRSAMNLEASHYALADESSCGSAADLNTSVAGDVDGSHFRRNLAVNLLPTGAGVVGADGGGAGGGASVCDVSTLNASYASGAGGGGRVLAFKPRPQPLSTDDGAAASMRALYTQNKGAAPRIKSARHIPSAPERILDAPEMVDDYYLNLMDWSPSNLLAVALGPRVYVWNR